MKFLLPLLLLSTYTYVDSMPVRPQEGSPVVHTLYNRLPNLGLKGLKEQIMISAHSESNRDISNDNAPVVSDGNDAPIETIDPARIPVAHATASSCTNGFQTYADTTWNLMGLPFTIAYTLQACIDICNTAGSTTCAAAVWYNGNACVAYTQAQTVGQTMMPSPDPKLPRTLITRCSTSITQAPVTQAPVTQAPVTQAPVTQAPVTQAPVTQAPVTQAPVTQAPATKAPVTQAPATQAPPSTCPNGFNTYTDSTYDLMGLSYTVVYTAAGCLSLCSTQSATTCSAAVWYNGNACVMYTQAQATGKVIMKSPDPALPRTLFVRCATTIVTPAPVTQAPVTQAPVTQAPVTQAPVTQAPATKAPVTQAPATSAPTYPVLNPDTSAPGSHGLSYLGGSVMTNPVKVYLIYYGTWTTAQELQGIDIINTFVTNLGTSQWWNIQTTYYFPNPTTGVRTYVQNGVTLGGYVNLPLDANNGGTSLTDTQVSNIVSGAVTSGKLPYDSDGVYIMLSSSEVYQNGFCSSDCGWHSAAYVSGTSKIMKYGWVGDASTQCPGACTGFGSYATPNGNKGADGIISVLAHEIAETVSDPLLSAWRGSDYTENADKCAWNFGQTYLTAAGAKANIKVGTKDYLVQTNWKNRDGGACVLHL